MKRRGLMYLLLSGCVLVCRLQPDGFVRRFHAVAEKKSWTDAQSYCRDTFTDLASIKGLSHNTAVQQAAVHGQFWIGLLNGNWKWSQQENVIVSVADAIGTWDHDQPKQNCVTVSESGKWSSQDCSTPLYLICYSAASNLHILVTQSMSWSDAQTYCRSTYTDLSTVQNLTENQGIISLLETPKVPAAWIGLHRNWMWSDATDAPYRHWAKDQPDTKKNCVKMSIDDQKADWSTETCSDKISFICYSDDRVTALQSVRVRLSGGSVDLNDPALQDAILLQLQQKLEAAGIGERVTLRWREQPDGKVFHRAPPAGEEEDPGIVT